MSKVVRVLVLFCLLAVCHNLVARADTLYFLSPACRVVDTRVVYGALPASSVRNIWLRTLSLPSHNQGGTAGCVIPSNATAVVIQLTAINPDRSGHVVVWPYNHIPPGISSMNLTTGITNNEQLQVNLCNALPCDYDLSIYSFPGAHYTLDLIGWYEP